MQVRDIMNSGMERIARDAPIRDAAGIMRDHDIGMLPVEDNGTIVGTITDRDITVRATANNASPETTLVSDAMSSDLISCAEDDDIQVAADLMEKNQVRRLVVQDGSGNPVGMLTLADLARQERTGNVSSEVLEEVSQPTA